MARVLIETKRVQPYKQTVEKLEAKISKAFKGKKPEDAIVYKFPKSYSTDDGPVMIAVAKVGNYYIFLYS